MFLTLQSQLNLLVLFGPFTGRQVHDSVEGSITLVQLGEGGLSLTGAAQHWHCLKV
jgi:hypothetical protein